MQRKRQVQNVRTTSKRKTTTKRKKRRTGAKKATGTKRKGTTKRKKRRAVESQSGPWSCGQSVKNQILMERPHYAKNSNGYKT